MTATIAAAPAVTQRKHSAAPAFKALLLRDLRVLRKNLGEFIPRTILQPVLLVFVFTYVFPKIGQGVGGAGRGAEQFSTILVAGVVALSIMFQGIQSVALPMVQEFGYTKEIEDRVLAPLPVSMVAVEKVVAGALNGLFAALIVFPVAAIVPATPLHLALNWPVLITMIPLTCVMSAALGLFFGVLFDPRTLPMMFGIVILPLTFLGGTYYSWKSLAPIGWLKWGVLINPLIYETEGFRAALVKGASHMNYFSIYGALLGFTALLMYLGVRGFKKRVVA
jgi:ABC-2 type transport system permease protein